MDRARASAQGSHSPVAAMPSPTFIRTARMSAPERVSFADFAVEGGLLDSLPQPPPDFSFASSTAARTSDTTGLLSPAASSEARRSTRKRKAPELLEPSPEPDHRPRKRKAEPKKPPPSSLKREPARLKKDPDEPSCDCCICMTEPEPEELATINGCEHYFCFGCIEKWADRENTCPLCKTRFGKIERVHKPKRQKGVKTPKSSVKVKDKSQRMELTSSLALEGLFGELGRSGIAFESFFARLGSTRFNTHIARIVVGGPGMRSVAASDPTSSASAGPSTRSTSRSPYARSSSESAARASSGRSFADVMFGDEGDESDEDDDGFSGFVNSIRSMDGIRSGSFSFSGLSGIPFPPPAPYRRPARSFATNSDQVNAGGSAATPLEIADSDDEDDEVVVVGSRRTASRLATHSTPRMSSGPRISTLYHAPRRISGRMSTSGPASQRQRSSSPPPSP